MLRSTLIASHVHTLIASHGIVRRTFIQSTPTNLRIHTTHPFPLTRLETQLPSKALYRSPHHARLSSPSPPPDCPLYDIRYAIHPNPDAKRFHTPTPTLTRCTIRYGIIIVQAR
ncbi:hypothetical protein RhiXN_02333 [Rhizoctonia solani]|uniref:Uncharacterized protein n=1 Tax=Rhizoctonia solani TaxID=456999 RepID=A0A8H8PAF8_9AGAM|nr:uncharacterized protein RhiXN_02333 [Rhizoctonia solani]QRW27738.1 hypothetical protein RhiXN_02333 [Rhizoctonia solani]